MSAIETTQDDINAAAKKIAVKIGAIADENAIGSNDDSGYLDIISHVGDLVRVLEMKPGVVIPFSQDATQ